MKQPELFNEMPLSKLSRDLLASDRKGCRPETGVLTGHCTLKRHLYIVDLSDSNMRWKC
jgi:hypothetical protein